MGGFGYIAKCDKVLPNGYRLAVDLLVSRLYLAYLILYLTHHGIAYDKAVVAHSRYENAVGKIVPIDALAVEFP